MKKLFAVLLAVAMLLSLGVTAFADDPTGKITVVNAPEGVSYRAYKLFDAEKTDDNKVVYTIAADSKWLPYLIYKAPVTSGDGVDAYKARWKAVHGEDTYNAAIDETSAKLPMTVDDKVGFEFIYDEASAKYTVKAKTDYDAAKFAAYLRELVDQTDVPNMSVTDLNALTYTASTDVAFNPDAREMAKLDDGYYLVLAGDTIPETYKMKDDCKTTYTNTTTYPDKIDEARYNNLNAVEKYLYVTPGVADASDFDSDNNTNELVYSRKADIDADINKATYDALPNYAKSLYEVKTVNPDFDPISDTGMLTTVLDGQDVQIQNKNDMPLDKKVGTGEDADGKFDGEYDDNTTGVQVGDTLYYEVLTQVPVLTASQTSYVFQLKDDMTAGLTPGESIKITVKDGWLSNQAAIDTWIRAKAAYDADPENEDDPGEAPDPAYNGDLVIYLQRVDDTHVTVTTWKARADEKATDAIPTGSDENADTVKTDKLWFETKDYDPSFEMSNGNYVRFNKNGYAWELSLDVAGKYDLAKNPAVNPYSFRQFSGKEVKIEYSATVNSEAVSEVLTNHVLLTYGENGEFNKDGETKNYLSKIVIDKYETGSPSQKLQGAEFALYKAEVHNWVSKQTDAYTYTNANVDATSGYVPADSTAVPQKGEDGEDMYDIYKKGDDTITNTQYKALTNKTGWTKQETLIKWAQWDEVDGELKLAKLNADGTKHVKADGTTVTTNAAEFGYYGKEDVVVKWVLVDAKTFDPADETTAASTFTRVRTNRDGAAQFGYLPDSEKDIMAAEGDGVNKAESELNAYYLVETKAPVDYARLVNPVRVDVDGKAATAPNMSETQQQTILSNVAAIANTPGSTLPSTGGVGATMMTIGGVALILAAGAFLVLRRRKEQE